jgi:hypothetical protein
MGDFPPTASGPGSDLGPGPGLTLVESARRLARYRWVEERLFETIGSWVPQVPEPRVKATLAAQAGRHAWHAEIWRARMPVVAGLNPAAPAAPPGGHLEQFMRVLAEPDKPEQTVEKLVGLYRVLLPHKVGAYTAHLRGASVAADGPVARWLAVVLRDEVDDWREGELLLQSLMGDGDVVQRAAAHRLRLEALMVQAGGVCGEGASGLCRPGP